MRAKTINMRRGAFGQPSVPFLLSRRAHLLTTPKGRWYCLRQPCALRGGCGFCGSLMDNATALRRCCHCPRSRLYVLLHHQNSCFRFGNNSPPACENLPPAVLDLCQYFEHKKLKGYADFFNSSSSFCCGVI